MDAYQLYSEARSATGSSRSAAARPHDCAKGARVVAAHDGRNTNEFQGTNVSEKLANPPHIAINTTVGTGSETTPFYVITDTTSENAPHKWVGFDQATTTTLAINDPVLMMTQPPQLVAYTGFDTLAHATECYTNRVAMPSVMPEALRAAQMVEENLREATANPHNAEGHDRTCAGPSTWPPRRSPRGCSASCTRSRTPCARYYDIHHGLNNGVGMARVWTYNQSAAMDRYADIGRAMHARDAADDQPPGLRRGDRERHPPRARPAASRRTSRPRAPYPKSRIGQGWYSDRPTEIKSDDEELTCDGPAPRRRPLHAGQPADHHRGGRRGDPARLRLRLDGLQGRARRSTAAPRSGPTPPTDAADRGPAVETRRSSARGRSPAGGLEAVLRASGSVDEVFAGIDEVRDPAARAGLRVRPPRGHRRVPGHGDRQAGAGRGPGRAWARPSSPRRWPAALERELIRLQCYEGLDESKALYEWEYGKQLLYTQVLREKIGELLEPAQRPARRRPPCCATRRTCSSRTASWSSARSWPRIRAERPPVLLLDEIDRADEEFEAFLLEFLVRLPGLDPRDRHGPKRSAPPVVVLTSNRSRELSEALKRRCLHLQLDYPTAGDGAGDRPAQGARDRPTGWPRSSWRTIQRHARARAAQGAEHRRDARLGAGAGRARARRASRPS